jgi:hypothetical protein
MPLDDYFPRTSTGLNADHAGIHADHTGVHGDHNVPECADDVADGQSTSPTAATTGSLISMKR